MVLYWAGGAVCWCLKGYEHAKARGAKSYAEIVGFGTHEHDAYHMTSPRKMAQALRWRWLTRCVMMPRLSLLRLATSTRGTSTPAGDKAERRRVKVVFGDAAKYGDGESSTKSMTGHHLGAANMVNLYCSILALRSQAIPPTINHGWRMAKVAIWTSCRTKRARSTRSGVRSV